MLKGKYGYLTAIFAVFVLGASAVVLLGNANADGTSIKMGLVDFNDPYSTFVIKIWDLPSDHELEDGVYPGWCIEKDENIYGGNTYSAKIYYSYDPSIPTKWSTYEFDKVNYLINNRGDYTSPVVQQAIWHFCGTEYTGSNYGVLDLIKKADLYGDGFEPGEDDIVAWLIDAGDDVQDTMIEVPYEPDDEDGDMGARTIGYWKTHPGVWDDWVPEEGSIFRIYYDEDTEELDQDTLLSFFPGKGKDGKMETWQMVRAQLLAVELNIAMFGEGTDWDFDYENYDDVDIAKWVTNAYKFLDYYCDIDSNGYWEGPDLKKGSSEYKIYKESGSDIIEMLDTFNNMGDEIFE